MFELLRGPAGSAESAAGRYFRMLFIGFFEGLSSERGIAWRVADSLSLRSFLGLDVTEAAPDHSTLSRTRRRIDEETHEAVFTWVLERTAEADLVRGKTIGIDATTLEANAAMRSIDRRDTGESHEAFVRRLAEASGIATPTRAELARFDRSRKDKTASTNPSWGAKDRYDVRTRKRLTPRLRNRRAPSSYDVRLTRRSANESRTTCRLLGSFAMGCCPWRHCS